MIELLDTVVSPWVVKTKMEANNFYTKISSIYSESVEKNLFILDGSKMLDYDGLYGEFSKIMSFPEYFGRNLNAFDECLADLEWLNLNYYILFISNADEMLKNEKVGALDILIEIFINAAEEFSEPIAQGEEWDREAIPFHVILQSMNINVDEISKAEV